MTTPAGRLAVVISLAALLVTLVPAPPSHAAPAGAVYVVTRADDPPPTGSCASDCSLRDAVLAANTNPGPDTIVLKHYTTYVLNIPPSGPDDSHTGDLHLTESVNFDYGGSCLIFTDCAAVIRGGPGWHDRVFSIENNAAVSMPAVKIEFGNTTVYGGGIQIDSGSALTLTGSTIMSNTSLLNGGGIYNLGSLTLDGVTVTQNRAQYGGGINSGPASTVAVYNSTISSNQAQAAGGGLLTDDTTIISNTAISSNQALGDSGGGFYFGGDTQADVINSIISSNTTGHLVDFTHRGVGGGLFDESGTLNVTHSMLLLNSADCGGGIGTWLNANVRVADSVIFGNSAISSTLSPGDGGGICAADVFNTAAITVTNSTINQNSAQGSGGGIVADYASLYNVTVSGNIADSNHDGRGDGGGLYIPGASLMNIANSILAGNVDTGSQPPECAGTELHSLGFNLIQGGMTCTLTGVTTGNKPGQDPLLGPLTANGGGTLTQALLSGSPAINAGNPAGCRDDLGALLTTDQRGFPRFLRCDMGAFEVQPSHQVFLALTRR